MHFHVPNVKNLNMKKVWKDSVFWFLFIFIWGLGFKSSFIQLSQEWWFSLPFIYLSINLFFPLSLSHTQPFLPGHVTQQQTCGNCSEAVKLKASPESQRKQVKKTHEQPQSVDTHPCICQVDLDSLSIRSHLGKLSPHPALWETPKQQ